MKITYDKRLIIYGTVLLYLALDLFAFRGPLRRNIDARKIDSAQSIQTALQKGHVAIVFGRPIHKDQLLHQAHHHAWTTGRTWETISTPEKKIILKNSLNQLIEHQILREKTNANSNNITVTDQQITQAIQNLAARFPSRDELEKSVKAQGIQSEQELKLRIKAQLEQQQYIERQITNLIQVSDQEAQDFYQSNKSKLANPPRIHARHIFLPTLDKNPDEIKTKAQTILDTLIKKEKTFEALAAEHSEDPKTKNTGGDLGWLSQTRLPADFTAPAFTYPLNTPTLLRTKLGYHILEVLAKHPAQEKDFATCKQEIIHQLSQQKRPQAVKNLRKAIREDHKLYIHIYQNVLDSLTP